MTLSSETVRVSYSGNGSTTAFPVSFVFWDNSDILAVLRTNSTGAETTWVLGTNYTLTGGNGATGTLTATVAPATGTTLVITSNRPLTQTNSYPLGGDFPSTVAEQTDDKNVRLIQQMDRDVDRSMKFPLTDSTSLSTSVPSSVDRAGKYLVFNASGEISVSSGTGTDNALRTDLADSTNLVMGDALVAFKRNATGATALTLHSWHEKQVFHVGEFGAVGDGVTDDRAAIQAAITACRAAGGGRVRIPAGTYLIQSTTGDATKENGILVPYSADELNAGGTPTRVILDCDPQTTFLAGSNDMVVIRFSDTLGAITGFPCVKANSKTGVWAYGLIPEDMAQTTTCVFQCYNYLEICSRDTDEGLVMAGGPTVALRNSGCWYNHIHHYHWGGKRGRYLKHATDSGAVVNNRNTFLGRVGNSTCNTGITIESGNSNKDYTHYEGISTGTSPNATPTGTEVESGTPGDNADNEIYSYFESCTRWIENAANSTKFLGPILDLSKVLFTVRPIVIVTRQAGASTEGLIEGQNVTARQDAPASPTANFLYGNLIPKGWIKFTGAAGTKIGGSANVSVARSATGVYTVTFAPAASSANEVAAVATAEGAVCEIDTYATTSFRLLTKDYAGGAVDATRVAVTIAAASAYA